MKPVRRWLPIWGVILGLSIGSAHSYDEQGRFMRGGGAGSASCSAFTSDFVKAQLAGGVNSMEGVELTRNYTMYILGFQTGYNLGAPGTYDIFRKWGDHPSDRALFWVNNWCQQSPSMLFGEGLIALAVALKE